MNNKNVKADKQPYPWKTVLVWAIAIFVAGYFGVRPPEEFAGNTAIAFKIVIALIFSVFISLIIAIYKYFRR